MILEKPVAKLTEEDRDYLDQIHQTAARVQQMVINMLTHDRVGRDWRMSMVVDSDRIRDIATKLGR
jgi:hypothetical protein